VRGLATERRERPGHEEPADQPDEQDRLGGTERPADRTLEPGQDAVAQPAGKGAADR
jgi:hypothetical protein